MEEDASSEVSQWLRLPQDCAAPQASGSSGVRSCPLGSERAGGSGADSQLQVFAPKGSAGKGLRDCRASPTSVSSACRPGPLGSARPGGFSVGSKPHVPDPKVASAGNGSQDCVASQASLSGWLRPCPLGSGSSGCSGADSRLKVSGPKGLVSNGQTHPSLTVQSVFSKNCTNRLALDDIANLQDFEGSFEATVTPESRCPNWPCPVCGVAVPYGSKTHHLKTRHPECSLRLFERALPTPVAFARELPAGQSGFKCPLCHMCIPYLASQDRKRAKRHHVETAHPDFRGGLRAFHALSLKGKPQRTKGVSCRNKAEHAARRETDFSTHTIVEVAIAARNELGQRGTAHYCKVCLTPLSKRSGVGATMTCCEIQERLRTNPHCKRLRLCWWVRLKASDPKQADALCQAVGRSKSDLDRECGMFEPHTDRSRGWARKRSLEGARPQFRKRGKQPLLRCEAAAPARTYSENFFQNLKKARQARKKAAAAKASKTGRKATLKKPAAATRS